MIQRLIISLPAFLACAAAAFAQQGPQHDLEKVNQAFINRDYAFAMQYKIFRNASDAGPVESQESFLAKKGGRIYHETGDKLFSFTGEEVTVTVHEGKKQVTVSKTAEMRLHKKYLGQVGELLDQCGQVTRKQVDAGHKALILECPSGQYEKFRMVYNTRTWLLREMEFFYKEMPRYGNARPRMLISFTARQLEDGAFDKLYRPHEYVSKQDQEYKLQPAYEDYQLHDQRWDVSYKH